MNSYPIYDPTLGAGAFPYGIHPTTMQHMQQAATHAALPAAHHSTSSSHSASSKKSQHAASSSHGDDGGQKKGRKPYTITKPRESWTKEEHQFFLEALQLYERDWKKIGAHIPTKSIIQIRSHAQKYFIKMAKMGLKDFIPAPARPKRAKGSSKKGGHKSKRQKTDDGEGGEDDEDEGEDGEDEDEGDYDENDDETGTAGGDDDTSEVPVEDPAPLTRKTSAASSTSPAKPPRPTPAVSSSARKPPVKPSTVTSTLRKTPLKRNVSQESQPEVDDGTRRSGRKRKMKKRFGDEDYGSAGEADDQPEEEHHDESELVDDPNGEENDSEMPDQETVPSSGGTSSYASSHHLTVPLHDSSNPSTPMRKPGSSAVGPGLLSLSQLSPLSQLTQAGSLADIASPHLLPQSAVFGSKMKPTLGQRGGIGLNKTSQAMNRSTQPAPLAIDTHDSAHSNEPTEDANADAEPQPEFAKVYSFLGSLFDPSTSGHIEELDKMNPVNKEIVQKLMQNLTSQSQIWRSSRTDCLFRLTHVLTLFLCILRPVLANLSSSTSQPSSSSYPPSTTTDPLASLLGPSNRLSQLVAPPKHVRTGSLGSIGSLDMSSPDMAHRWIDGAGNMPSVSPLPPVTTSTAQSTNGNLAATSLGPLASASSSSSSTTLTSANGSPQPTFLTRSFSNGLSVHIHPPSSSSASGTSVSSMTGAGSSSVLGSSSLPPTGVGSAGWSSDKSRPGFASNALVSRITARGALSPLTVTPITSSWPTTQGSPTASSTMAYSYAAMSPNTANTPLSFVGSPGGFFSPVLTGATVGGPNLVQAQSEANLPQYIYPAVKPETTATNTTTTTATTTTVPAASSSDTPATSSSSSSSLSSSTTTSTSVPSSAAPLSTPSRPTPSLTTATATDPNHLISPSSAGSVLASLLTSPVPTTKPAQS